MNEIVTALSSHPAPSIALATVVAFALDRTLRRAVRRIQHRRAHGRDEAALVPATLAATRLLLGLLRGATWLALVWISGEISPSLRFVRELVYVVGTTAITAPVFMLNQRGYSILDVIELPIAVLVAWLGVRTVARLFESRLDHSGRVDAGTRQALALLMRAGLGFAAAMVILRSWGVDLQSLTLAASVVGVGIGFGLQNMTSNFVSGLLVSLERPIRPGDFVRVAELTGTVERIGLRSTEIVTLDRVSILVPNSAFLEKEVINWSHGDPVYRLHVPVGVAYDSDVSTVRSALLEAAAGHRAVLRDPKPRVEFHGFGASALEFVLLVWGSDPKQQARLLSDMNYRVEASLRSHGIRIPFPQLDLNVRTPASLPALAGTTPLEALAPVRPPPVAEHAAVRDAADARLYPARHEPQLTTGSAGCLGDGATDATATNGSPELPPALAGAFDEVCDTRAWTDSELQALAARMRGPEGVAIEDRRYRLRLYRHCFVGRDAVDWLVKALGVSRQEAVELGQLLVVRGLAHHVAEEQPFKDGFFFYRLRHAAPTIEAGAAA